MHYDIDKLITPPKVQLPAGVKVVLASGSPRRKELCTRMGLVFEICPSTCNEDYDKTKITPREAVELLSIRKCRDVASRMGDDLLVIASDTMVEVEGEPQGKPKSHAHAKEMLEKLSGRNNVVHTGLAVSYRGQMLSSVDSTEVHFRHITADEILDYANSDEVMDKAGAYAVQGRGGDFISHFDGRLDTVVGLCCEQLADAICKLVGDCK